MGAGMVAACPPRPHQNTARHRQRAARQGGQGACKIMPREARAALILPQQAAQRVCRTRERPENRGFRSTK